MYLQITTKCNMRCAHCMFSCAPNKGEHMSLTTFHKALELSKNTDEYISVGGGEPTLHPHFEQIMYECISATSTDTPLWIVTNGTHKRRSMMLADLCDKNIIKVRLSIDQFHNKKMVHPDVLDRYTDGGWLWGNVINGIARNRRPDQIMKNGRGKNVQEATGGPDCGCTDMIIQPTGKIRQCGCDDAPVIGNVNKGITVKNYYSSCYHEK